MGSTKKAKASEIAASPGPCLDTRPPTPGVRPSVWLPGPGPWPNRTDDFPFCSPRMASHCPAQRGCDSETVPHPRAGAQLEGEGGVWGTPAIRIKTQGGASVPTRARPGVPDPARRPAHLQVPGKGQSRAEAQPDAAAPGPAHWPSSRPTPSSAASRPNPEGLLPGPPPAGLVLQRPRPLRAGGRRQGPAEEATGIRGGRRPEVCGPEA